MSTESNLQKIHVFQTVESYEQNKGSVGENDIALIPSESNDAGLYVVEIGGVVPDGPYEVNKSVAEIQAAYNAGKSVVAKVQYKNSMGITATTSVPLTNVTSEVATFSKVLGNVMYLANLTISWNGTAVLASFAESHSHKADDIVQMSLTTTDIQNIRVRGMSFSSTTPSSVSNGCLVGVYE